MPNVLIETITSHDDSIRNRSIHLLLRHKNLSALLLLAEETNAFRKASGNLYHKVRASLFLFVLYKFYLEKSDEVSQCGEIPFEGVKAAFERDFEKAIEIYLRSGQNCAVFSAIGDSYYKLSFKYLLDQVKLSISSCSDNYLLYNIAGLDDYPYSVPAELIIPDAETGLFPVGLDASPVRLDPSHSGWSDIFFLGMDFPEGARVVNMSVNLGIHGSRDEILPPCECYCRYIEEPAIHLVSIDLRTSKNISSLNELFNFGNDYLSLLKAGVVASGVIPPCFEKKDISLKDILRKLLGKSGGIEIVTRVNNIPKGSRLAVSTTLLATIIARLMRFSGQIKNQTGTLTDDERRIVASRAILGEWLGGSGGGWQDSGGLWPGIKIITGKFSREGDPEYGVSKGCLLPEHNVFTRNELSPDIEGKILASMVIIHGGISQDVGPVLEMVTEKYLLKYEKEWNARLQGIELFDRIVEALKSGDMKSLGKLTTEDWNGPIQNVIPWVNNSFTEDLINKARTEFGESYWGFLMLGGMSGGGMAFIVDPVIRENFKNRITEIMLDLKALYASSYPFIIDPVVYDFEINHDGLVAKLLKGKEAKMPEVSKLPAMSLREAPATKQSQKEEIATHPSDARNDNNKHFDENEIRQLFGFDAKSHEHMKALLKRGDIGLARNRLPFDTKIENVSESEIQHFEDKGNPLSSPFIKGGIKSLKDNEIAVVSFAGGMGSRWTHGASVVKPVNPFIKMDGRYRTFLEVHLAKSRKTSRIYGHDIQHIFTTSYLTHNAIETYMRRFNYFNYKGKVYLSPAKAIGHRVYPMERDLRFYWEEQLQQKLDDNVQKVQDNTHRALISWAKTKGEGEDYCENKPFLRFNPPGHWYEIPNMIKNGVLTRMIKDNPNLKYLLCHNIDTLGANIEPELLGMHIANSSCLTFEVTPRRVEDAGGGLAKINGRVQLIEGLAMPREEDEYKLSYYNTLTCWITIDALLEYFKISRELLFRAEGDTDAKNRIAECIHGVEKKVPTYVTIKNVKHVWGSGQEDVYPVAQFEKLWGDMTVLNDLKVSYVSVSRYRGLQLKEPSLLDIWASDGSFDYVTGKTSFL